MHLTLVRRILEREDWSRQTGELLILKPYIIRQPVLMHLQVSVHDTESDAMTFVNKNFKYTTMSFGNFVDKANSSGKVYLRSLSAAKPAEIPASLERDFPTISSDFTLPSSLFTTVISSAHSSPLRISGSTAIWLHYDVMANILTQITGKKDLMLYPPSDVSYLSIPPGQSSSTIESVWTSDAVSHHPALRYAHPHIAKLSPGDILFIPPLWLHTAKPTTGFSVGVNVFFQNLNAGYAPGKDVYGNRDLQAYEKGRADVEKIVKSFQKLPGDISQFYLNRLADELKDKAKASYA
jgi:tRNA wybutosine-synthesizing protein 4